MLLQRQPSKLLTWEIKPLPVSKATPPTMAVPSSVEDTPTEPVTSPRNLDPPVREYPVEIGPHPEPEVYPIRHLMNDGQ